MIVLAPKPRPWSRMPDVTEIQLLSWNESEDISIKPEDTKPQETPSQPEKTEPKIIHIDPENIEEKPQRERPREIISKKVEIVASNQLKLDTKDFPFSYYLNFLKKRIQDNWHPPYQSSDPGSTLKVTIGFRILRDGRLTEVKLESSSGFFMFDQAAQRAVYSANRMPPLPEGYLDEFLTIHLEFESKW